MSSSFFMENQYPDEAKREEIANACNSVIQKPGSKRGSSVKRTFLSSENTSCWIDVSWQVISRWCSSLLVFFFFLVKMLPAAYRMGTPAAFLSCTSFINAVGESKWARALAFSWSFWLDRSNLLKMFFLITELLHHSWILKLLRSWWSYVNSLIRSHQSSLKVAHLEAVAL